MTDARKAKLISFYRTYRRMPSVREIMDLCDLSSRSSAFYVATQWIKEGWVEKDSSGKLIPAPGLFSIARLGRVRAGFAAPAEEELADTISLGEYLIGDPNASYLLTVEGDSMEGAGILSGDQVLFERTNDYKPGDIVVALIEDGYTLKYLRKQGTTLYLEAANDAYPNIYPKEGQIVGKVTSTFRRYS